jgi:hypothetical protein
VVRSYLIGTFSPPHIACLSLTFETKYYNYLFHSGMKPWAEMRTKVESVMRTSKYSVIVGAHNRQQYGGAGWPEFMTQQIIWGVERIDVHDGWNPGTTCSFVYNSPIFFL